MPIAHILCNVENFRSGAWPDADGEDVFVDEMRVQGWFLAHAPVSSMELAFDDPTIGRFEVQKTGEPSHGVWAHHGSVFGAQARACRFLGAWAPLPNAGGGPGPRGCGSR